MKTSFSVSRSRVWSLTACIGMIAINAFAQMITMTHTGVGSGTIGDAPFFDRTFTITEVADTANRVSFSGGFSLDDSSASIAISGVGNFLFTSGTRTFVNNDIATVGFSRAGSQQQDLFNGPTDPVFSSWNMLSSIGPITGPGQILQWTFSPVTTDGGILIFNDAFTTVTFQATVVPEPSCIVMLLGGAVCWLRRRPS